MVVTTASVEGTLSQFRFSQMHMGVAVRLTLFAPDQATAARAGAAAFARFAELDAIMSDYQQQSELNRLCRRAGAGPIAVSPELFEVLSFASHLSDLSGGEFDVTSAPAVKLWRSARIDCRLPSSDSLKSALALVDRRRVTLDPGSRTVALDLGTTLDLGSIAKGYACDEALASLATNGVKSGMVEAGGDIAVSAPPPGKPGWRIAVHGFDRPIELAHRALSTSGDDEQFVEIGGVRYSHIVDPRTGLGLTNQAQVTVVGRRGMWTDACATAECLSAGIADRLGLGLRIFRFGGCAVGR